MNGNGIRRDIMVVACLATLFMVAGAAVAEPVQLDKRYVDAMHGFSLRPPAGGQRATDASSGNLVSWVYRDEQHGAWSLSVGTALESNPPSDLQAYADALAEKLRQEKDLKVESVRLAPAAGKAAMHFRGQTHGLPMWQRQSWVQSQPGVFLIVQMQGPQEMADRLDATAEAVLGSLEVNDPQVAIELRRANLQRGQNLLASLKAEDLAGAIGDRPEWFLLRMKGEEVGFCRIAGSQARREKADGFLVKMLLLMEMPGDQPRMVRQELFVTPDLQVGRWLKRLQVGTGESVSVVDESGLRQGNLIVCDVMEDGRIETFKKNVPGPFYLPHAVGILLPRLVDLSRPAAYAFATYSLERNDFDMRTFTVIGPQRVEVLGREVQAVVATDRLSEDAEPARLYLDPSGKLLRMTTPDGVAMEQAGEQAVMRRFPQAERIIKAIGE